MVNRDRLLVRQTRYQSSESSGTCNARTASHKASMRPDPVMGIGRAGWRKIQAYAMVAAETP